MAKYRVTIIETVLYETTVEASDEIEARLIVQGTNHEDWTEVEGSAYWESGEIERVRQLREVEL
jgi:hypothetical protein